MKHNNRLRVLRAERRLSQLVVATRAGLDPSRYWKIENGYVAATDTQRAAIASILGVAESDAFQYDEAQAS